MSNESEFPEVDASNADSHESSLPQNPEPAESLEPAEPIQPVEPDPASVADSGQAVSEASEEPTVPNAEDLASDVPVDPDAVASVDESEASAPQPVEPEPEIPEASHTDEATEGSDTSEAAEAPEVADAETAEITEVAEIESPETESAEAEDGGTPTESAEEPPADAGLDTESEPSAAEPESDPAPELDHQPVIGESATRIPGGEHGAPKRPAGPAVHVGRMVDVTVTAVRDDEVEVKFADGRLGVIPRADVDGADGRMPGVGDPMVVALLAREDPKGRVVLSRSWAAKQQAWERLENAHTSHTPLTGTVQKAVKGGLLVAVGVPGFLPASLVEEHSVDNLDAYVGQELEVLVSEIDKGAGKVVLNRRDVLRRQRREKEKELYSALSVGDRVTGRVISTADYGVLIEVNGVRGLLHRTEMSWGWTQDPATMYSVGQSVEVLVSDINKSRKRVSLSVRQLTPDPFSTLEPGTIIEATISRVVEYGAFALIDNTEIEGLVHISEISDVPGFRPEHLVAPGERVVAKVLAVDGKRRRIGLSIRQAVMIDGDL